MKRNDKATLDRYKKKLELSRSFSNVNPFETDKEKREAIEVAKKSYRAMVQRAHV